MNTNLKAATVVAIALLAAGKAHAGGLGDIPATFLGNDLTMAENGSNGPREGAKGTNSDQQHAAVAPAIRDTWNWFNRRDQPVPGYNAGVGAIGAGFLGDQNPRSPGDLDAGFLGGEPANPGFVQDNLTGGSSGGPGDW
jgi:hypothetical protein